LDLPCWNNLTITQFPNYRLGEWNNSPCDTLNGQKPGDGFTATEYAPERFRKDTAYTLLPPIPGAACPGCSARDIEILNNPMELCRALIELQSTGQLPADWPVQRMESEGLSIKPKPKNE
jgi:hypothetical protein